MNQFNNIRTVRFFANQGAEDLYKCDETESIYVRQPVDTQGKYVKWCATSKYSGGFEADCPLKEGLAMHIVDNTGCLMFCEKMVPAEWDSGQISEKTAPFSYEALKVLGKSIANRYGLPMSYDQWAAWLIQKAPDTFKGERDTWLYDATKEDAEVLSKEFVLGQPVLVVRTEYQHNLCSARYAVYEVRNLVNTVLEICGFETIM